jgi:hypothetical protein
MSVYGNYRLRLFHRRRPALARARQFFLELEWPHVYPTLIERPRATKQGFSATVTLGCYEGASVPVWLAGVGGLLHDLLDQCPGLKISGTCRHGDEKGIIKRWEILRPRTDELRHDCLTWLFDNSPEFMLLAFQSIRDKSKGDGVSAADAALKPYNAAMEQSLQEVKKLVRKLGRRPRPPRS